MGPPSKGRGQICFRRMACRQERRTEKSIVIVAIAILLASLAVCFSHSIFSIMADASVITPMEVDAPSKMMKRDETQLPWVEKYRPQR